MQVPVLTLQGIPNKKTLPQHANPKGNINKPSNLLPFVVVNPPQNEISLTQETLSHQLQLLHSAPDLATVQAACELEAAGGVISKMRDFAVPAQGAASVEINDNPIALVDSVSSFLETLAKFNDIVYNIATVMSCYALITAHILIFYLDPSLCASSMGNPLSCFQGSYIV